MGSTWKNAMLSVGILSLILGAWLPGHAQEKRIYIAPDDHTDYMWAADESTYQARFVEMIDYYLNLADQTASELPEYQSKWNCDGSFWLWTYERSKSSTDFDRLMSRIRSGHISVPLNPLVQILGGTPTEAVLRGMYYAGQIERRYNVRFPLAYAVENQTLPLGLGSLWAGAGAKYSWRGVCNCATKVPGLGNRQYPIYWWTGLDGAKVLMKWYPILTTNDSLGGYAEARDPSTAVDRADSYSQTSAYPYSVIGAFGKGWDDVATFTNEFLTVAKSKTTSTRKVIVSNEIDFFQDFEATYGAGLPSLSASFGNEWETYTASMAEVTSRVRRAVEKLRAAEALATLVSLQNPSFMSTRISTRDQAFMDLGLYWEHDWTADGPVSRSSRAAWQRRLAGAIESYVDTLQTDAANALASLIKTSGANLRFYVFNPLSWVRTDFAEIPYADTTSVHVIDLSSGSEVPSQIVTGNGVRRLRIQAPSIPSFGYKVFEVRPGAGLSFADAATATGNVLENPFYRVTVADRGAISSLIDKTRGNREFTKTVNGRTINDLGAATGTLQLESIGPVSATLVATASAPLSHTTRITLYRDSRRIDIQNDIQQNFGGTFTWGFGFNLTSPDLWHEEVGAVLRAKLLANGGHYSPQDARYDWLTLNHFADMSGGGVGVTLSNADTSFMKVGNSTATSLDTATPQISPLAGGQVDGSSYGIVNQGGDSAFLQRFALQTHDAFNQAEAMRFALEHQNPLIASVIAGGSAYPETTYSFLTVSDPNVVVWALKPSEEGIAQGVITRAWNLAPTASDASLTFANAITSAKLTTHIETNLNDAAFVDSTLPASFGQNQMKTYRVNLQGGGSGITPPSAPANLQVH